MFNSKLKKEITSLRAEMVKLRNEQMDFLVRAREIMKSVLDSSKQKYMYTIRQEDVELCEDGKKFRAIRKIIE